MPILEDEHGTYIMNSKDLRAVEQRRTVDQVGADSLKVEGRTKSLVLRCTHYRCIVAPSTMQSPAARSTPNCWPIWMVWGQPRLHRRFSTSATIHGTTRITSRAIPDPSAASMSAKCRPRPGKRLGNCFGKNRFQIGDRFEIIQPEGNQIIELTSMTTTDGLPLQIASGPGYTRAYPSVRQLQSGGCWRDSCNRQQAYALLGLPSGGFNR